MSDWRGEFKAAVEAFRNVAVLGQIVLTESDLQVEFLPAPHKPPNRIPTGKMAVYAFWGDGCWLKVGKVGPNSHARYTSQHYSSGSALSTLAGSLERCPLVGARSDFKAVHTGNWIRSNTHRANILIDADQPRELLSLLEAFLHLRLRPRYEG